MLHRTRSQETISTLTNDRTPSSSSLSSSLASPVPTRQRLHLPQQESDANDANDTDDFDSSSDLISFMSQDTLIQPQMKVLNHAVTEFRFIKEIPILSCFLQTGVHLYPSWSAISRNQPILTRPSKFINNIFKLNSPFLVIESYTNSANPKLLKSQTSPPTSSSRQVFCRVDFKIQSTRITYYVLTFPTLDKSIYLINNNSHAPSVDFELNGSYFRVLGITGTTSALGTSGLIKLYVMENSPDLLTYDTQIDYKKKKLTFGKDNELNRLINSQNRAAINESMQRAKKLFNMPVAQFMDHGDVKIKIDHNGVEASGQHQHQKSQQQHHHHHSSGNSFVKHGIIKMFDYVGGIGDQQDEMSQEMMMICCVLLVLREQEYRKYKGDKKPQLI
ncbi:hypothetical protein CANMA_001112 [Candida margitis]|uniref:uncharacterized protein n=1 Tax=Candida margitis TaxID=1775924 RepID=UPI002225E4DC|nr:uncharacterized protein CANMA_001112 [Candida margitis]KAI5969822.1 hypothetical protein CANMA_001112 [Candida margitis]